MQKKTCKICNEELSIDEFYPMLNRGRVYHSSYCKTCQNQKSKTYRSGRKNNYSYTKKSSLAVAFNEHECRKIMESLSYAEEYIGDAFTPEIRQIKDKIFSIFPTLKNFSLENNSYLVMEDTPAVKVTGKDVMLKKGQIVYQIDKNKYNEFSMTEDYDVDDTIIIRDFTNISFYGL